MKSYFNVFQVSASALEAQRRRMNVITSNMANINTTRTDQGGPYRRKDVVFTPKIVEANPVELQGVRIAEIVEDKTSFKKIYDPGHPDADKDGYVEMPNVNIIEEMVNMMAAMRAYEASVSAFNTAKSIFLKSLEIGRM